MKQPLPLLSFRFGVLAVSCQLEPAGRSEALETPRQVWDKPGSTKTKQTDNGKVTTQVRHGSHVSKPDQTLALQAFALQDGHEKKRHGNNDAWQCLVSALQLDSAVSLHGTDFLINRICQQRLSSVGLWQDEEAPLLAKQDKREHTGSWMTGSGIQLRVNSRAHSD